MCANDLVLKAQVKQLHHLFESGALVGEQVLHCVHIIVIPFQLKSGRVGLGGPKLDLAPFLTEEGTVQEVVDLLIVDLHEGNVDADLTIVDGFDLLDLIEELSSASLDET